jgi:integrase
VTLTPFYGLFYGLIVTNRNEEKPKRWEPTRVAGLYRHVQSKRYFGRWHSEGKQIWKALGTSVFSVAEQQFLKESADFKATRAQKPARGKGKVTMGDIATRYLELVAARDDLKESSKSARRHAVARVLRTWPGFDRLAPGAVTLARVTEWAARMKRDGAAFIPPGAKRALAGNSATAINTAVDALRRMLDVAASEGHVYGNPARLKPVEGGRLKKRIVQKRVSLPSAAQLQALFDNIEKQSGGAGWGLEIADFLRLVAYSGCRLAEAAALTWQDVDWTRKTLRVLGTKTESSARMVPLFPPLVELLTRIQIRRRLQAEIAVDGQPYVAPTARIARVGEAQRSIDRACVELKLPRFTHHDLRHAFATVAIEAGIDIPTVARWMGHADGGALLMKTYAHLRDAHSQTSAAKMTWLAPVAPVEAFPTGTAKTS